MNSRYEPYGQPHQNTYEPYGQPHQNTYGPYGSSYQNRYVNYIPILPSPPPNPHVQPRPQPLTAPPQIPHSRYGKVEARNILPNSIIKKGVALNTWKLHRRIERWNEREEKDLNENIKRLNQILSKMGTETSWPCIQLYLNDCKEFRDCLQSFFKAYDNMQKKLGNPRQRRGAEYNPNLLCIFYYYCRRQAYAEEGNYLCKLPVWIFEDKRQEMENILNQFD